MANPTLHWRMLPPAFITNATTASLLDAIYTMGLSTVYADGSARAPGAFAAPNVGQVPLAAGPTSLGTGSAWTWNYDATTFATGAKTAVYAYPPAAGAGLNQQVVISGTTSVVGAVWKQLSTDTRLPNFLYIGLGKNSGLYQGWNNATTPFNVGDFTGCGYICANASFYSYVYMWECEEAIAIQFLNSANASGGFAGAFIDPLSVNAANAETDGRIYGISTSGSGNYLGASSLGVTAAASGPMFYQSGTSGDIHFVTFTPGAGTVAATFRFGSFAPGAAFTSRNGDLPQVPIQVWTGTQYVGQLRQIFITRDSVTGNQWQAGATPKGYLWSSSLTAATDTVILAY